MSGWTGIRGATLWLAALLPVPQADGLDGLHRAPQGAARRVSSTSPNGQGNEDQQVIAAGAELTVAELSGPGLITHFWLTLDSLDPAISRRVVLRIFWDGESRPSVEVPVGDFFAVGHGLDREVRSVPVRVQGDGRSRNCYWPMPFNGTALVALRNDSGFPVRLLSYHIDWRAMDQPHPEPVRTFHATYSHGFGEAGEWVLADIDGRGHYVGTVMSLYTGEDGWPGEGDDRFYLDGAESPTLQGTGLEQYFCDAWTFREDHGPYSGVSVYEGSGAGSRLSAYRWHVQDPIPFETGLKVAFETLGWSRRGGTWTLVRDRPDHWSGVAFWYQEEPHGAQPDLPAGARRLPYNEQRFEAEDHQALWRRSPETDLDVQEGELWAFGAQARFVADSRETAVLEIPLPIVNARDYDLAVRWTRTPDGGLYELWLDGEFLAGPFDLYSPRTRIEERRLGRCQLSAGTHTLTLRAIGHNVESRGYSVGVDSIMIRWPSP